MAGSVLRMTVWWEVQVQFFDLTFVLKITTTQSPNVCCKAYMFAQIENKQIKEDLKKIFIFLLIISVILFIIGLYFASPAAKMDGYVKYYTNDTSTLKSGNVRITYFGVSTLLLDDGETQILIDGFFSRPSILKVLASRISTDTSIVTRVISQYGIDKLKAVFVTHSHYEHALDAAYIAKKTNSDLLGSLSTFNIGLGGGLNKNQISIFDLEKEYQYGDFCVKIILSKHSPAASYNDDLGEVISTPIEQPAYASDYVEGGSFDFFVRHKEHTIYIKPSANYITDKLKDIKSDVLFLGVGGLSNQDSVFISQYYRQTVEMLMPRIVIPLHWDNFFLPLSDNLKMNPRLMDKTYKGFDYLIDRTESSAVKFTILQGGKSIILFN